MGQRKKRTDRKEPPGCMAGGGCLALGGGFWAGFWAFVMLGAVVDEKDDPILVYILLSLAALVGLIGVLWGFRQRKKARLQLAIVNIIAGQGHRSLDHIVVLMEEIGHVQDAVEEIQAVMNKGYLPGLILDIENNRIREHQYGKAQYMPKDKNIAFRCQSCGAANNFKTKGGPIHCRYCGSAHIPANEDSFQID